MAEPQAGEPGEAPDRLSHRVRVLDPAALGLGVLAIALVALDLSWSPFSRWTMDHPAVTAVVTGVLVGLIAGLLLDRRARQREQEPYRFLRLAAVKGMCTAARVLSSELPSDETNDQEIAIGQDALRTFKRELSSWQSVLLAIDQADPLSLIAGWWDTREVPFCSPAAVGPD